MLVEELVEVQDQVVTAQAALNAGSMQLAIKETVKEVKLLFIVSDHFSKAPM